MGGGIPFECALEVVETNKVQCSNGACAFSHGMGSARMMGNHEHAQYTIHAVHNTLKVERLAALCDTCFDFALV